MKSFGECFFFNTLQLRLVHKTKRYFIWHIDSVPSVHIAVLLLQQIIAFQIYIPIYRCSHARTTRPNQLALCHAFSLFLNFFVVVWLKCFQLWKICCYCMTIWLWLDFSCWLDSANRRLAYKHFCSCSWEYNIEYMHVAGVVCFTPCTCG